MIVGVFSPELARTVAEGLALLGTSRAFVVHGAGGVDELSPAGLNLVFDAEGDQVTESTLDPRSGRGLAPMRSSASGRTALPAAAVDHDDDRVRPSAARKEQLAALAVVRPVAMHRARDEGERSAP